MIVLPISNTVGCHESAPRQPQVSNADLIAETLSRQDALLDDIDNFANWLAGQCYQAKPDHCRIGYVPRAKDRKLLFIEALDVPQLVAAMLYPDRELSAMAISAIRDRYLKHHGEL